MQEKKCPKCKYGWLQKLLITKRAKMEEIWACDECKYTEEIN